MARLEKQDREKNIHSYKYKYLAQTPRFARDPHPPVFLKVF